MSIGGLLGYVDLETGPAEKAAGWLDGFFKNKGGAWGKTLAVVGATAGGALAAGVVGAINMEPSRDRVVAALDLTEEAAARAGKVSGQLFADAWGDSAAEVDSAVEAVMSSIKGMRNASEGELRKTTEAALALSSAMEVDVVRASQVAGNMMSNGLAKDGVSAMDMLAKAMSKVPVQLREDVLDAADEYGQFFSQLGIKGPQAMALLTQSAGKGMYGIDKMGDAIKEFTIRATDGSTATTDALKAVGLDADKVGVDLLAGGDRAAGAFDKVVSALVSVKDPAAQSQAALALFGTPLEDLGTKDIPKFLKSLKTGGKGMKDWQGATSRMSDTMGGNASTNLKKFTRGIQTGLVDLVGGKVLPVLEDWTGSLSTSLGPALETAGSAVQSVTGFLQEHKTVAIVLASVIGALTAVTAAHSAVMAVSAAGGMAKWLMQTQLISAATKVWTAVQWALNSSLLANPITWVVLALAGLVAGLVIAWKKSDTFRAIVISAWEAIKSATVTAFGAVKDAVVKAFGFLKNIFLNFTGPGLIIKHWDKIKSVTGKVWSAIKSAVSAGINGVKGAIGGLAALPGKVAGWFGAMRDSARQKAQALLNFVNGIPGKILGALGDLGSILRDAGRKIIGGLIDGITDKIGALKGKLKEITGKLTSWKGPPSTDKKILRKNGRLILRGLIDGINDEVPNLKKLLRDVTDKLGKKRLARVEQAVKAQYQKGLKIAAQRSEVAAKIEKATGELEAAIKLRDDFYANVYDSSVSYASLSAAAEGAADAKGIVAGLQARYDAIERFRENMQTLLAKGLDDDSYQQMLEDGVDRAGAIADALVKDDESIAAIGDLQGKIKTASAALASESSKHLYQAGVDMAQGTANGLASQAAYLESVATQIGTQMAAALSKALKVAVDVSGSVKPQGQSQGGNGKSKKDKSQLGATPTPRAAPLIGAVYQQPGESSSVLAERLGLLVRTGG